MHTQGWHTSKELKKSSTRGLLQSNNELKSAEDLLGEANTLLAAVDTAPFFQQQEKREYPSFDRSELDIGKILGIGGFGVVQSIEGILLDDGRDAERKAATRRSSSLNTEGNHYDIKTAREHMSQYCLRHGDARYAVKLNREVGLSDVQRAQGRIDLAIEVKYLSALDHPNIIKMRGVCKAEDPVDPDFFFLMDRLYGTLEDRLKDWANREKETRVFKLLPLRSKAGRLESTSLLIDRMVVAYDLACAFRYMHSHMLIYRDIKPENVGFDVRNDVKVFDFGLAKSLTPNQRDENGLYRLTRAGSIPYMAPEVTLKQPYNEKCDVYSFGVLLWRLISLRYPFATIKSKEDYISKVAKGGRRPSLQRKWPTFATNLITSCCDTCIANRPSFQEIRDTLEVGVNDLSEFDVSVSERSYEMRVKSTLSFRRDSTVADSST